MTAQDRVDAALTTAARQVIGRDLGEQMLHVMKAGFTAVLSELAPKERPEPDLSKDEERMLTLPASTHAAVVEALWKVAYPEFDPLEPWENVRDHLQEVAKEALDLLDGEVSR